MSRIRTALVVEGGGVRSAFSAGALSELGRLGHTHFDAAYGASAGAACATFFVTGQSDLAVTVWKDRTYGRHLVSGANLLRGEPFMDVEGLIETFRNERPLRTERVDTAKTELYLSVTNCVTGRTEYLRPNRHNVLDVLHASMARPVAYGKVVKLGGQPYVDGGIGDPIPFSRALARGAEKLVVLLNRPLGYQKKLSRVAQLALELNYRQYPNLWPRHRERADLYNEQVAEIIELERQGRVIVIRPEAALPTSRISRDRSKIIEAIALGRQAVLRAASQGSFAGLATR